MGKDVAMDDKVPFLGQQMSIIFLANKFVINYFNKKKTS